MINEAPVGAYRYTLRREAPLWLVPREADPWLFVMLNPSTADDSTDDPTIRRCVGFAFGHENVPRFDVVNLFALRATDPRELATAPDPVGPENDATLLEAMRRRAFIVCAWGAHPMARRRVPRFLQLHREAGSRPIWCLGTTADGSPRHPLYLPSSARPVPWTPPAAEGRS